MADTGFQTQTFKDGSAWYDIVFASDKSFAVDSLAAYTQKIVHAETEFFHDTPFDHYTFLINAPTFSHSPAAGGFGALEHANSSAYLLANVPWFTFKQFGLDILSHEFFHLWNVKRIHSSLLGPFDYTKRVMTTSLWLSEGITDYYAHTILTRWNIAPYRSFEQTVGNLLYQIKSSDAARTKNLEELSIAESDFDLTNALVFYSKGTLVGLMLDIEIRSRTNNKKTLDDVMLALNAEAKKGKTFQDKDLIGKMEKITGLNLQDFYKKYIAGTDSLPLGEFLKKMGVGKDTASVSEEKPNLGGEMKMAENGAFYFARITPGGILDKAGVESGDTLKMFNGEPFSVEKAMEFGQLMKPPVTFDLDVARTSGMKHVTLTLDKPKVRKSTKDFAPLPDATPLEVAIRHGIVGKEY
jgi:predicted metalloprotease with PDZ domain